MNILLDFVNSSAVWGVLLTLAAFALGTLLNHRTGKAFSIRFCWVAFL